MGGWERTLNTRQPSCRSVEGSCSVGEDCRTPVLRCWALHGFHAHADPCSACSSLRLSRVSRAATCPRLTISRACSGPRSRCCPALSLYGGWRPANPLPNNPSGASSFSQGNFENLHAAAHSAIAAPRNPPQNNDKFHSQFTFTADRAINSQWQPCAPTCAAYRQHASQP